MTTVTAKRTTKKATTKKETPSPQGYADRLALLDQEVLESNAALTAEADALDKDREDAADKLEDATAKVNDVLRDWQTKPSLPASAHMEAEAERFMWENIVKGLEDRAAMTRRKRVELHPLHLAQAVADVLRENLHGGNRVPVVALSTEPDAPELAETPVIAVIAHSDVELRPDGAIGGSVIVHQWRDSLIAPLAEDAILDALRKGGVYGMPNRAMSFTTRELDNGVTVDVVSFTVGAADVRPLFLPSFSTYEGRMAVIGLIQEAGNRAEDALQWMVDVSKVDVTEAEAGPGIRKVDLVAHFTIGGKAKELQSERFYASNNGLDQARQRQDFGALNRCVSEKIETNALVPYLGEVLDGSLTRSRDHNGMPTGWTLRLVAQHRTSLN